MIDRNDEWIDPLTVEQDYRIPRGTQAIWRCQNRYRFAELARKCGSRVRYKRGRLEKWLDERTLGASR